jgi:hypothetical protein
MRHRLESSIYRSSYKDIDQRSHEKGISGLEPSCPGSDSASVAQRYPEPGSGARILCKISPNEQGSHRIDEWLSTGERDGISMKASPSFLQNEHTLLLLPFQNVERSIN